MPRQVIQFRKWGESRVVTVVKNVWQQLGWRVGDVLQVTVHGDELRVRRVYSPVQPGTKVEIERPAEEVGR